MSLNDVLVECQPTDGTVHRVRGVARVVGGGEGGGGGGGSVRRSCGREREVLACRPVVIYHCSRWQQLGRLLCAGAGKSKRPTEFYPHILLPCGVTCQRPILWSASKTTVVLIK